MAEKFSKPELLAPAGNPASLKAACLAGADALYISGKRFGARAFAANFDEMAMRWARRVTVSLGKKLYVTLNTIVFEKEWKILAETIEFYKSLQPDALIVQDIGVARELQRQKSQIPLHLSTQAAWFGNGALAELKELGISRVILPRELSFEEIEKIVVAYPELEFEMFVHGAMCYSISGRCYWSIALGSRSGNRGTCAQPCRKEYSDISKPTQGEHLFSPRDLRLIDHIPSLADSGIHSLKIEGRMKSPEYVYQVVKVYRRALDEHETNTSELDEVYTRSCSEGYFNGPLEKSKWRTKDDPGRNGVLVGYASGRNKDGLTEIKLLKSVQPGEGIYWFSDDKRQGNKITWIQKEPEKQYHVWVRGLKGKLKADTAIFRISGNRENNWEKDWNRNWERRPVDLFWSGYEGSCLAVEARLNGHPLRIESEEKLAFALKKGLEEGPLEKKFAVLGEFFRSGRNIYERLGKGLHISSSALKKMKRTLVENLVKFEQLSPPATDGRGIIHIMAPKKKKLENNIFNKKQEPKLYLKVWNQSFPFVRDIGPDCWVLPWKTDSTKIKRIVSSPIAHWLPPIVNFEQFERLKVELAEVKEGEFFCAGWEIFDLCRLFPRLKFRSDWTFNVCNLMAVDYLAGKNIKTVFSREWKDDLIPADLVGFRCASPWNPLVSMSRFKPSIETGDVVQNSHNDRFFLMNIGNGVSGLFLMDKPAAIYVGGSSSIMLDVAVAPNENPIQAAKDLNRMIESVRADRA
ncbi:MAG: peptidase U32 family protein [Candidatus Rifleibacteriota bacterium]